MTRKTINALMLWGMLCLTSIVHAQATGTVTYVYADHQGTTLAEADAQGNITATYDYQPYGAQALGTAPNGPGYTGHVNDPDTGLVYMQARYYDPALARFLSVDPVTPSAGNSFNFNRYIYVNNNPLVRIDPDGRQDTDPSMTAPCGDCIRPPAAVLDKAAEAMDFVDEATTAYPGAGFEHAAAVPLVAGLKEAAAAVKLAHLAEDAAKGAKAEAGAAKALAEESKTLLGSAGKAQGPRYARGNLRQQVLDSARQEDGSVKCAYCSKNTATTSDHVKAYSKGGSTTRSNLVPACTSCNSSKGAKDLGTEWVPPNDRQEIQ